MKYAELQCRTNYSFLRGASHPAQLVAQAVKLGLQALAITDLDGVYGIPKAYRESLKHPGLKLLVGSELSLEGGLSGVPSLTLLAKDRAGYGLLCRLLTQSRAGKPKGECGLAWADFLRGLEDRSGARGLLALPRWDPAIPRRKDASSELPDLGVLREIFSDRIYLPISRFLDGADPWRMERARELRRRYAMKWVAVNDVHYHVPERRALQDALVAIRENIALSEAGTRLFPNGERYLKPAAQMRALFRDLPEAVDHTIEVAERCSFSPAELRYRYPSEWIPAGQTAQSYLEKVTWEGAARRYPESIPEAVARQLRHELSLIEELRFADYFLTIWEIVEFARSREILCQGRGSAANSTVCYCLGITAIDPVRMNLLFERFLSAERGEPPDIDVDFEHERREEVIQHVYAKYGRDRAAMVAAVITYRSRSAIRDIGKAFGFSPSEAAERIEAEPRAKALVEEIRGFPRHLSIHSGGFTLSADPIIETVPVEPARMEGRTIVQWDKDDLATMGLLKVDLLSLGMLTAIRKSIDFVNARPVARQSARRLTLATIPAEDPATYAMMQRADTVGVFQIESRAQMSMLPRLKPRTFYDLVIQVAIVRPGPIVGQMVHPYLRRRRGLESPSCHDPRLEAILGKTLGVPLFQEQVMKMAMVLAGFTAGEADELRRAISGWGKSHNSHEVIGGDLGKKLRDGLLASGLPGEFTDRIFQQIQGFAEYGFPESHAASFGLLAYASAFLKRHFPLEFICALLNSQPMGFYSVHTLVEDSRRHGVEVRPVHPGISDWDCSIEEGRALRLGLRLVRGLGEEAARELIAERKKRAFSGLPDFLARSRLGAQSLHHLAMGDAFSCFGFSRREALWEILAWQWLRRRDEIQGDLFSGGFFLESELGAAERSFRFAELGEYEAIRADFRAFGVSVNGHPMGALRKTLKGRIPSASARSVKALPHASFVRVAGLVIVRQRPPTARGTQFATLEDDTGLLDLILKPDAAESYGDLLKESPFVVVSGVVQVDGDCVQVIVKKVVPMAMG